MVQDPDRHPLRQVIEEAWRNRELLRSLEVRRAVAEVIALLDSGQLRVATPVEGVANSSEDLGVEGRWRVHGWLQQAILLYFLVRKSRTYKTALWEFYDKIPVKRNFESVGVRVVPPATIRYGAYVARGCVVMPSYINIGAYVDEGTMVDTWATVGSCAQVGKRVHVSGGVGIGGVLEPPQSRPVIIEDDCFLGSRCVVVEGVVVCRGSVLGAGVVLTGSTRIIDVRGEAPRVYRGYVPPYSVVIPGQVPKAFPGGTYLIPCALIIGRRGPRTEAKVALNEALRQVDGLDKDGFAVIE